MNVQTDDEILLTRYLLGELPEAEQLLVEERFFADDAYFEQLLALENELKYDYARGGLSAQQRARFAQRFLKTPEERRGAAMAGAILNTVAEAHAARRPEPARDEQPAQWRRWLAFFSLSNPAWQFAMAAAGLAVLLGGAWLLFDGLRLRNELAQLRTAAEREQQVAQRQAAGQGAQQEQLQSELEQERQRRNQLEQQLAQQKNEQAEAAKKQPSLLAFTLFSGLVRGETAETKRLIVSADVNALRLRLNLKKKGDFVRYRGALQTLDGAELWSQDIRRSQTSGQVQAVTWYLPARLFTAGDYLILLKGITADGETVEVGDYYFTVVRK